MATISFSPSTNNTKLTRNLIQEVSRDIRPKINKAIPQIKRIMRSNMIQAINNSPVIASLKSSNPQDLRASLGMRPEEVDERIQSIVNFWINRAVVKTTPIVARNQRITGGLSIEFLGRDYTDVIRIPAAIINTEGGRELNWLQWLLIEGTGTIITGYDAKYIPRLKSGSRSRTNVIMVKNSRNNFSISGVFAGTNDDNFVTKALSQQESVVNSAISKVLDRIVK